MIGLMEVLAVTAIAVGVVLWLFVIGFLLWWIKGLNIKTPVKVVFMIGVLVIGLSSVGLLLIATWLGVLVYALYLLRQSELAPEIKVVWALLVVGAPILGVVAFVILNPCGNDGLNQLFDSTANLISGLRNRISAQTVTEP